MEVIRNTNSTFTKAKDVKIPEIYGRRFKTGAEDFDIIFGGEGFLPGMSLTLAAEAGSGKTTMLLQILQMLEGQGKRTAYISGEECVEQLAFTCRRLGVRDVSVANMTDFDEIEKAIRREKFDFVVLDSYPALRINRKGLKPMQMQNEIANRIVQVAKDTETVIATILHFTKTGTYKGSTLLPHSVDCTIVMNRSKEDECMREIEVTKNRMGSTGVTIFPFTAQGFVFEAQDAVDKSDKVVKAPKGRKANSGDQIVHFIKGKGKATLAEISEQFSNISMAYMSQILRGLVQSGKLQKQGRGQDTVYV